jgi:general secretion pathway protein L
VPVSLGIFFRSRAETVVVDISGADVVVLLRCSDKACEEIDRFSSTESSEGLAKDALAGVNAVRQKFALRLSASQALRKSISLPAATEGDLRDILSHQVEQLTPFQASEAYFGYRVTSRDRGRSQIEVELTVAPKRYVDAALSRVGAWGFVPDIVDISGPDPMAQPEINLIAGNGGPVRPDPWPRINIALVAMAAFLALAAVIIPLDRARITADELLGEVTELRRASKQMLDLRGQRDDLLKKVRFLADQKLRRPSVLMVLNELTRIIGKDTWLYEIRINRPEIRISGYSPSASSLIGKINDSPIFWNPRFRSPVTRPANMDKERFNLSFESSPSTQPGAE